MNWYATKTAVWTHSAHGEILVADCTNKNVPLADQRLNARVIAAAPEMLELLKSINFEPDQLNHYREILDGIYG